LILINKNQEIMIAVNNVNIFLIKGDITKQTTDCIVNAANSSLMGGGGVDGAIHRAGGTAIKDECKKIISRIGHLDTGKAVITTGGKLPARYIIHTVGPIWHGGNSNEPSLLFEAYQECLKLATAYKLQSISFPSISTGAYGYPLIDASRIAIDSVKTFLRNNATSLQKIIFVLFDEYTLKVYNESLE
jgi:O-acetyl-ADP-ribose deacetylase